MRLTIFNGSPRRKKSNTRLLLEEFSRGYSENPGSSIDLRYICIEKDMDRLLDAYKEADAVLIAFPLYCDSMPARMNEFFGALSKFKGHSDNPAMLFLVQSGFPEAHHSRFVERYLKKLTSRLNSKYMGCMIKGGVEGIQDMPKFMTKKTFNGFYSLGKNFGQSELLDEKSLKKLAGLERFKGISAFILKLMKATGITNLGWKKHLKDNDAYDKRNDAPYGKSVLAG